MNKGYTTTVVVGGKKYSSQREASLKCGGDGGKTPPIKRQATGVDRDNPVEVKHYKTYTNLKNMVKCVVGKVAVPVDPMFTTYHNFKRLVPMPPTPQHRLARIDKSVGFLTSNLHWIE